jgi:hypothetical protein
MDATSNFGLRFPQASGSNAGMPERLLRRQALERTVIGLSLVSQALAFSIFGMLIIANRHQADLNDFADGSFVATVGGAGALLVGIAFTIAAFFYWRFCTRRSTGVAASRNTARLTFARPESATRIASLA